MKKALIFLILLLISVTLSARVKFDERMIREELRKPGVKLVAVDFYMTGCPPCDKAIKKWKELKQQYGDTLKLIVVAPQRPDGSCNVKGWNPDRMICDNSQEIAGNWGVRDFPQAFLYSWHNDYPLLEHSQVRDVEEKIKEYLKNIPRVAIDADKNTKNLVPLIEEELIRNSKIELVANESERRLLVELREESYNGQYDDDLRCELGKEISPNSVLKVTKQGADLVLRLSSVAKSCTMAAATKTLSRNQSNLKTEIAAVVYDLLSQMFGHISKPGEGGNAAKPQKQPEQTSNQSLAAADPKDKHACEFARNNSQNDMDAWELYLKKFPKGVCSGEAKITIENYKNQKRAEKERALYENAKKENTLAAWEKYLREFPDEEHSFEAELYMKKAQEKYLQGRKIGNLIWSDRSPNEMNWSSAKQYCEDLNEGGFDDWRLPNIDELRTLLIADRVSSRCKVSERNNCLSLKDCWFCSTCTQTGTENSGGGCSDWGTAYTDGRYSRLGDGKVWLWSSSTRSGSTTDGAWGVNFGHGGVYGDLKSYNSYVRCVR